MPKTNHPRISQTQWEIHKETIRKMYLSEDKSLMGEGGVIDLMKRKGFSASKPQYESQFMRWGFKKKLTRETWHIIGHIIKDRGEAGLVSRVYAHGTSLAAEKVKKETARYKCEGNEECCLKKELPTGIEVRSDQAGAEEMILSLEAQDMYLNDLQIINPPTNLHIPEEPWNLVSDYNYPMNNPDDIYNRVVTDHPTPISYRAMSLEFSHSDTLSLDAYTLQSPTDLFPGIREFQGTLYVPKNTFSLFTDLNKPLFREFRALFRNNQSNILASINQTKYLLPRDPGRELQKHSVDKVILKHILYLLMNNFAGSDYAVFDSIFEQVKQFPVPHMEDMLDALPHPYAAALQQSILTIAIKSNIPDLVSVLLRRGLDVNRVICRFGGSQFTPLGLACKFRRLEVVKILLRAGADPNRRIHQNSKPGPIILLFFGDGNYGKPEPFSVPVVSNILRILLDAHSKVELEVLGLPAFWANETLIDVYIQHNKLPVDSYRQTYILFGDRLPGEARIWRGGKATAVFRSASQGLQHDSVMVMGYFRHILGIASYHGILSLVECCLELGLTPTSECLCGAVYGNNLLLVERYVQLGVKAHERCNPVFRPKSPVWMFPSNVDSFLLGGYSFETDQVTAFAEAIRHGRQEMISLFKSCSVTQANTSQVDVNEAILAAAEVGNRDTVHELLAMDKKKAERNIDYNSRSVTAATLWGHDDIVELLMRAGVRPGHTSIAAAILTRNARLVELFLNSAIIIQSETALAYLAVRWGDRNILRLFIDAGVSFSGVKTDLSPLRLPSLAKSGGFLRPLEEAIRQGDHEVVQLLLEHGADVNGYSDAYDNSPLARAVEFGDERLIQTLLDHGADPNDPLALQAAVKKSRKLTRVILVSFRQRYPDGNKSFAVPALREAISRRDETLVSMLVPHADVNFTLYTIDKYLSKYLPSLLGEGITTGDINIVQILLDSGGDPDSTVELSNQGRLNAVLKAVSTGNLGMIKILHSAKADLNFSATLRITRTALQLAVELGHFDILQFLLAQGVDVNASPCVWGGGTALQFAAKTGSRRIAELLLDYGANIDAPGSRYLGRTAFEFAAEHGRMDIILLLLHRGVDIVSDGGEQIRKAQELAEENGQIAIRDLVKQLGAEAQRRACFTFENNFSQGLTTDTSFNIGLLPNEHPHEHR